MTTHPTTVNNTPLRKKPSRNTKATAGRPDDIDRAAGWRIRERREIVGLTQIQLAEEIGVTYQQAHKYEKGINRISISRADRICHALGLTPNELIRGTPDVTPGRVGRADPLILRLARAARACPDRDLVIAFTRALEVSAGIKEG